MIDVVTVLKERLESHTARGVANAVSRAIRDGVLKPDMKLPPIRSIAKQLELSPTTVSAGWTLLARSGTIVTQGRRGTMIAEIHPGSARYRKALERQTSFDLDLSTGIPDPELLPDLRSVWKNLTTTAATPGSYLDEPVLPELIETLRADWPYSAEAFTILDGAMDALEMATRCFLRFGDRIVVEHPTFPLLLDQLEAAGADVVGVAVDDQGMIPEALTRALSGPTAAVVIQPRAQNPTGVSLTPSRAQELGQIVRASGVRVIEDDAAGSVATTAPISLGQWAPDQILHIRSFSKSHGPDLRLAAVSGPLDMIREMNARRQLGQGWSSRLLQRILLALLTDERAIEQVAHARQEYRRRREAVVASLAEQNVQVRGSDGINIWVPVVDETAAIVRLASQGIGVTPGAPFRVLPDKSGHIRITVGSVVGPYRELTNSIAMAARTGGWGGGR